MDKTYKPQEIERHWSMLWEKNHYAKPAGKGEPYCIMLPPPNVTGTLHMGHGFQQTLMDALIRYQRMQGKNTLWQSGTDHAGIATQMVVERQLAQKGQTRHELGREAFIDEVWQWREHSGDIITEQMSRLGLSIDWTRKRFTMDKAMSRATYEAFLRFYNDGLIYKGQKLVNWDPLLHTAISDLEVETEETDGHLWHFRYPVVGEKDYLVVATTRPETMLGDSAVAVHPNDERYQHLIGKRIALPLTDRVIPIITDEYVDRKFGTGCVKITPAHDFNDYELGKRHDLPLINILTPDAKLNEHAPKAYQGLERYEARKKIVADLKAENLVEKIENYRVSLPKGDRSGVVIEPYLTSQWFIKMKPLAEPAIEALKKGELNFIPTSWQKVYLQWLENIEDWCISRQLWWGHRIPVWHDESGHFFVGFDEGDVRQRYKIKPDVQLKQEDDVLDTWFSASLWPFGTLGWPEKTPELKSYYPTSVLVTGFDIIFFWVARMVMMGLKLTGKVPFKEVYITGLIRDSHGKKMSKSKGNVLDPIDLIDGIDLESLVEKRIKGLMQPHNQKSIGKTTQKEFPNGIAAHGTDALRFTFCALATTGRDINFDMGRIEGYRNFCNKIWNAARYVLMNTEGKDIGFDKAIEYTLADRWIRSKLQNVIQKANDYFQQYRFDLLANCLYEFVWNEYCDWYLELAKCHLTNNQTPTAQLRGTRLTLLSVLETTLRLLHPIMPFITEEIWQKVAPLVDRSEQSIMTAPYPHFENKEVDKSALQAIDWLKRLVIAIRTIRSEMNINPGKTITVLLDKGNSKDHKMATWLQDYIMSLAKVSEIRWAKASDELSTTATALIDTKAERTRLEKEIEKLNKELIKSTKKLENPNYVDKAPKAVVAKERKRLEQTQLTLKKLQSQLAGIK